MQWHKPDCHVFSESFMVHKLQTFILTILLVLAHNAGYVAILGFIALTRYVFRHKDKHEGDNRVLRLLPFSSKYKILHCINTLNHKTNHVTCGCSGI